MTEMSLYRRLKLRGVDMSWYESGKRTVGDAIPLDDQECSNSSVYLMKEDGTVWTLRLHRKVEVRDQEKVTTFTGQEFKQVRSTGVVMKQPTYVCMHTKVAYDGLGGALAHEECNAITGGPQAAKE